MERFMQKAKHFGVAISIITLAFFVSPALLYAGEENTGNVPEISLDKTLRTLEDSFKKTSEENKKLKKENDSVAKENEQLKSKMTQLEDEMKKLSQQGKDAERSAKELNVKTEMYTKRINQLSSDLEEMKTNEKKIKEENEKLNDMVGKLKSGKPQDEYVEKMKKIGEKAENSQKAMQEVAAEYEQLKNETGKVHYNLGNLYFKNGEYQKAVQEYEMAVKLIPKDPDVYYNLALTYDYYVKDPAKAYKCYETYITLQPKTEFFDFIKKRMALAEAGSKMDDSYDPDAPKL